jgi:hypothetical protein
MTEIERAHRLAPFTREQLDFLEKIEEVQTACAACRDARERLIDRPNDRDRQIALALAETHLKAVVALARGQLKIVPTEET